MVTKVGPCGARRCQALPAALRPGALEASLPPAMMLQILARARWGVLLRRLAAGTAWSGGHSGYTDILLLLSLSLPVPGGGVKIGPRKSLGWQERVVMWVNKCGGAEDSGLYGLARAQDGRGRRGKSGTHHRIPKAKAEPDVIPLAVGRKTRSKS